MRTILMALFFVVLTACTSLSKQAAPAAAEADEAAIMAMLTAQDEAWNRGDIDGFMASYLPTPDLRFASGGKVTRGWSDTYARYKARYPSRALMGQLTTSDLEIDILSPDVAVVHGRWQLTREKDRPWGLYTLILRKIDGEWLIVSDTTTSAEE